MDWINIGTRREACILNDYGQEVKTFTVRGGWSKMIERLETFAKTSGEKLAVGYEASCGYGALHERLSKIADRIIVAHPGHLRLIFRSKQKNDRVDAKKLAKLLFIGELPAVHVPELDTRNWRSLIEFRSRTVDKRTRVKNAIQSLLKSHGIRKPKEVRGLWSDEGRAWLGSIDWPHLNAELECEMLLEEYDQAEARVEKITKRLDQIGKNHPGVMLLRTIPGVGPRTAEAVMAYIDKPERFAKSKQVGSYFGFPPCQDESAGKGRFGHITRDGPPTARKMLTEAAWQAIGLDPTIKARFERIAGGKKDRRKIALVAIAHYLVKVMHAMLQSGEVWHSHESEHEASQAQSPSREAAA